MAGKWPENDRAPGDTNEAMDVSKYMSTSMSMSMSLIETRQKTGEAEGVMKLYVMWCKVM